MLKEKLPHSVLAPQVIVVDFGAVMFTLPKFDWWTEPDSGARTCVRTWVPAPPQTVSSEMEEMTSISLVKLFMPIPYCSGDASSRVHPRSNASQTAGSARIHVARAKIANPRARQMQEPARS